MRRVEYQTTRTGGGRQVYTRRHASLEAALADAERARAGGRDVTVVRCDVRESLLTRALASAPEMVLRVREVITRGATAAKDTSAAAQASPRTPDEGRP